MICEQLEKNPKISENFCNYGTFEIDSSRDDEMGDGFKFWKQSLNLTESDRGWHIIELKDFVKPYTSR